MGEGGAVRAAGSCASTLLVDCSTPPTVTKLSTATWYDELGYGTGQWIDLFVTFSGPVYATGHIGGGQFDGGVGGGGRGAGAMLGLETGVADGAASFVGDSVHPPMHGYAIASGNGTNRLRFHYR